MLLFLKGFLTKKLVLEFSLSEQLLLKICLLDVIAHLASLKFLFDAKALLLEANCAILLHNDSDVTLVFMPLFTLD